MPYYKGDYYRGDNYYRGDFLGLGKLAKGALKLVGKGISTAVGLTPIGRAAQTLLPAIAPRAFAGNQGMSIPSFPGPVPEPGVTGVVHRMVEGGHTGYGRYTASGEFTDRKRPRMNVTNVRALRRAGRRVRGFLKIASRLGALPVSRSAKGKLFKRKRRA